MGSAIVGEGQLHGHGASNKPELSSASLRNDKDNTLMQDDVPFALVVQR